MKTRQSSATMNAIIASSPSVPASSSLSSRPGRRRNVPRIAPTDTARAAATAASASVLVTPEKSSKKRKSTSSNASGTKRTKRGGKQNAKALSTVPRTESFEACWAGNFALTMSMQNPTIEPHTLILGTHPSVASLTDNQYYAHPQNAFWWIAGDCLGFRRDIGQSKSTGKAFALVESLRHDETKIVPYQQQLATLVSHGFAIWDVVASCQRPGSLDCDIRNECANDVWTFCRQHPSIQRLVFSNGGTTAALFAKHYADWLSSGQLVPYEQELSLKALKSISGPKGDADDSDTSMTSKEGWTSDYTITVVSTISVSPAAASYTYRQKRDFWDEHVYRPGLALWRDQYPNLDVAESATTTASPSNAATPVTSRYFQNK